MNQLLADKIRKEVELNLPFAKNPVSSFCEDKTEIIQWKTPPHIHFTADITKTTAELFMTNDKLARFAAQDWKPGDTISDEFLWVLGE